MTKVFILKFSNSGESEMQIYSTLQVAWDRKRQLQCLGKRVKLIQQTVYEQMLTTDYIYTGGRD